MSVRNDPRAANVEAGEFPILCETCLGPNPYVRMLKEQWGQACKVCERPFTAFRWRPAGMGMRPKKTEVCQTCARAKNVCQTCLLDLQFGLPVQVRDMAMAAGDVQRAVVPQSDATREYAAARADRAIATGEIDAVYAAPNVSSIAEKAKRTAPKYERNRARICTFFVKGECRRGLYCPYRHEMPTEKGNELADQNLRDRYYGVNDPVAAKIIARVGPDGQSGTGAKRGRSRNSQIPGQPPPPPQDHSIKALFVGGVAPGIDSDMLRGLFSQCPGITDVRVISEKKIAFVEFATRDAAEAAIKSMHGPRELNGARLAVSWGRGSGAGGVGRRDAGQASKRDSPHTVQASEESVNNEPTAKRPRAETTDATTSVGAAGEVASSDKAVAAEEPD